MNGFGFEWAHEGSREIDGDGGIFFELEPGAVCQVVFWIFPVLRGDEWVSDGVTVSGKEGVLVSEFGAVRKPVVEILFVFKVDGGEGGVAGGECDIGIEPDHSVPVETKREVEAVEVYKGRTGSDGGGIGGGVIFWAAFSGEIVESDASSSFDFEGEVFEGEGESWLCVLCIELVKGPCEVDG